MSRSSPFSFCSNQGWAFICSNGIWIGKHQVLFLLFVAFYVLFLVSYCLNLIHDHRDFWKFGLESQAWKQLPFHNQVCVRCLLFLIASFQIPRRRGHSSFIVNDLMVVLHGRGKKSCLNSCCAWSFSEERWFNVSTQHIFRKQANRCFSRLNSLLHLVYQHQDTFLVSQQ